MEAKVKVIEEKRETIKIKDLNLSKQTPLFMI
jgi:hypothetical protein